MSTVIRAMTVADVARLDGLEKEIFPDPWPPAAFEEHLGRADAGGLVAETDEGIMGYACYHVDRGEVHLTNLAVAPAYRRKSVANGLLEHILGLARSRECELIFLEVRTSNEIARKFYEASGFRTIDRCAGYYASPDEDALVMSRWVGDNADGE